MVLVENMLLKHRYFELLPRRKSSYTDGVELTVCGTQKKVKAKLLALDQNVHPKYIGMIDMTILPVDLSLSC